MDLVRSLSSRSPKILLVVSMNMSIAALIIMNEMNAPSHASRFNPKNINAPAPMRVVDDTAESIKASSPEFFSESDDNFSP